MNFIIWTDCCDGTVVQHFYILLMDKDLQIGSTQEAFARWFDLFVPKDYFLRFGISSNLIKKKHTKGLCSSSSKHHREEIMSEERAARVKAREERTNKNEAEKMANQQEAIRSKKADDSSNGLGMLIDAHAEKEQQKERQHASVKGEEGETKEEVDILEEEEEKESDEEESDSDTTSLTPTRELELDPASLTPSPTREARLAAFLLKKACLNKKKKTKKPFTGSRLPRDATGNIFIRW
jgi:hypothetical protein